MYITVEAFQLMSHSRTALSQEQLAEKSLNQKIPVSTQMYLLISVSTSLTLDQYLVVAMCPD